MENSGSLKIKQVDWSEFWWEQKKHINALSTILCRLKIFSANSTRWRPATMPGLGLLMIFLIKNQKHKNYVPNSQAKKISTNSRKFSRALARPIVRFWWKRVKNQRERRKAKHRLLTKQKRKKNNEDQMMTNCILK